MPKPASRPTRSSISSRPTGSRPAVGSSSRTSSGSATRAWASLVRWRMPVEKPPTGRNRASSRPTRSSTSEARWRAARAGSPASSPKVATRSAAVWSSGQAVVLGHVAEPAADADRVVGHGGRPPRSCPRSGASGRASAGTASSCRRRWRRRGRPSRGHVDGQAREAAVPPGYVMVRPAARSTGERACTGRSFAHAPGRVACSDRKSPRPGAARRCLDLALRPNSLAGPILKTGTKSAEPILDFSAGHPTAQREGRVGHRVTAVRASHSLRPWCRLLQVVRSHPAAVRVAHPHTRSRHLSGARIAVDVDRRVEALAHWLWAQTGDDHRHEPIFTSVLSHLDAAREAAVRPATRPWWRLSFREGRRLDLAIANLDAAEAMLLQVAPALDIRGQMPRLEGLVRRLPFGDPRRLRAEAIAGRAGGQDLTDTEREGLVSAVAASNRVAHAELVRLRRFRNVVAGATVTMAVLAITFVVAGAVAPSASALLPVRGSAGVSDGASPTKVEPPQGVRGNAALVLEVPGAVGATRPRPVVVATHCPAGEPATSAPCWSGASSSRFRPAR